MKSLVCLFLLVVGLAGCGKDDGSYIPSVSVNFQAPLNTPSLSKLNSPGGSVTVNGYGVAGLIIYRTGAGTYVAYDRCSSYQPEKRCAITIDDTGLTATDPCSGSKFLLSDGSPVKAPATRSLKAYSVYVNNFNIFVSN
jgi:nitrite reductase/ring-hydroxylating ferredoxin subunit